MTYTCDYCGSEWRSPISASLCCDIVSMEVDRDLDGEPIWSNGRMRSGPNGSR